jgi:hypothetical protein
LLELAQLLVLELAQLLVLGWELEQRLVSAQALGGSWNDGKTGQLVVQHTQVPSRDQLMYHRIKAITVIYEVQDSDAQSASVACSSITQISACRATFSDNVTSCWDHRGKRKKGDAVVRLKNKNDRGGREKLTCERQMTAEVARIF